MTEHTEKGVINVHERVNKNADDDYDQQKTGAASGMETGFIPDVFYSERKPVFITEYGFVHHTGASEGYFLDMTWKGCYIWNGEDQNYELEAKDFEGAELVSLDLEDDVPEKYEVKVRAWRAYD